MTLLLLDDLHQGRQTLAHPAELFMSMAVHSGMWRMPYQARAVLPLAVVVGALKGGRLP
jgi:hypothetical protein